MFSFYHQLGHNYKWNIDSIKEGAGDGVIIGPRNMSPKDVESISLKLRSTSFFDPQFFLPHSSRGKLVEYNFFPDVISGGFSTVEYSENDAVKSAELCIQFQLKNNFKYIVIPTRFIEGTPNSFIESQKQFSIDHFLKLCGNYSVKKPILLQLILNEQMLKEKNFRDTLINWITSIDDIKGVYLIFQRQPNRKQIDDIDLMIAMLTTITLLRRNDLEVILGYLNTEAIPLLAADPNGIATGSYENLRIFQPAAFDEPEERKIIRGPNPRIYISKLCQWIESRYIGAIKNVIPNTSDFFDKYSCGEIFDPSDNMHLFDLSQNWHFKDPILYKHYFFIFSKQIKQIVEYSSNSRFKVISDILKVALYQFETLEERGIFLDSDSGSKHLSAWLTALNLFVKEFGEAI